MQALFDLRMDSAHVADYHEQGRLPGCTGVSVCLHSYKLRSASSHAFCYRLRLRDEVVSYVKKLHGFGDFAASNVGMLLGFYDAIPMDSETVRVCMSPIYPWLDAARLAHRDRHPTLADACPAFAYVPTVCWVRM